MVIVRTMSAYNAAILETVKTIIENNGNDYRSVGSILAEAEKFISENVRISERHAITVPTNGIEVAEIFPEEIEIKA